MLCSKCHKNEATVFYKQNINGEVREYALCSHCASEGGNLFSSLNLFGSLFSNDLDKREHNRCTLCNSTIEDIRKRGKAGCSECYKVFKTELEPMIRSIHSAGSHKGRTPLVFAEKRKDEEKLRQLRTELNTAIEHEEYEQAALLRDRIRELEGGNK